MFLIYNQKYCYASSLNKLYEVFVCSRAAGNWQLYVNKREANCTLHNCAALAKRKAALAAVCSLL